MDETKKEFLLTEYASLREEILIAIQEITKIERYALIFSGAYWAWFFSNEIPFLVAVWAPMLFTLLFGMRVKSIGRQFGFFTNYLQKLESEFKLGGFGWEHHLKSEGLGWLGSYAKLFWGLLLVCNIVIAIVVLTEQHA